MPGFKIDGKSARALVTTLVHVSELVTATSIPREMLIQILALLVKAKILVNEELEQYDLNPGSFSYPNSFWACSFFFFT